MEGPETVGRIVKVKASDAMRTLVERVDLSSITSVDLPTRYAKLAKKGWKREADGA